MLVHILPIGTPSTKKPGCIAIETAGTAENRIKLWAAGDGNVIVDFINVNTEAVLNRIDRLWRNSIATFII